MKNQETSSRLQAIIKTLCTKSTNTAAKRQRLFQLKYWLLEDAPIDAEVLRSADRIFASLSVTVTLFKGILEAKEDHADATPSAVMEELLSDDTRFRTMLDLSFTNKGFRSLEVLESLSAKTQKQEYGEKVDSVNAFTEYCLRLSSTNSRATMTCAKELYARAAAKPASRLLKDVEPLRSMRRQRLSFLYVANKIAAHRTLLAFPSSPSEMWSLLGSQSRDVHSFKRFFARCAFVQGVVARGNECKSSEIAKWAGLPAPNGFKHLEPLSKEELATVVETQRSLSRGR